jgi:hypothetical protein
MKRPGSSSGLKSRMRLLLTKAATASSTNTIHHLIVLSIVKPDEVLAQSNKLFDHAPRLR